MGRWYGILGSPVAKEITSDASALTPVMRQYFAAKEQHPDCLMFCRIGDFYELFYEDAILVSRELQLTLTARDKEKKQPMCGVPYHAAEVYLQKLLRLGYKIALGEQMEDPKQTKTIVRREVTRVLTPGTALDPGLGAEQSNYLASICVSGRGATQVWGLVLLDLSTGEFRATEFAGSGAWAALVDELGRVRPVELLYGTGLLGGVGASSTAGPSTSLRFAQDDKFSTSSSVVHPTLRDETAKDGAPERFHPSKGEDEASGAGLDGI